MQSNNIFQELEQSPASAIQWNNKQAKPIKQMHKKIKSWEIKLMLGKSSEVLDIHTSHH